MDMVVTRKLLFLLGTKYWLSSHSHCVNWVLLPCDYNMNVYCRVIQNEKTEIMDLLILVFNKVKGKQSSNQEQVRT
jgi:hypothetical protein